MNIAPATTGWVGTAVEGGGGPLSAPNSLARNDGLGNSFTYGWSSGRSSSSPMRRRRNMSPGAMALSSTGSDSDPNEGVNVPLC